MRTLQEVRFFLNYEGGWWWAWSNELPGFTATDETREALEDRCLAALGPISEEMDFEWDHVLFVWEQ